MPTLLINQENVMYSPESMDDGGASTLQYAINAKAQTETWITQLASRIDDLERKVTGLQRSIDALVAGMQRP